MLTRPSGERQHDVSSKGVDSTILHIPPNDYSSYTTKHPRCEHLIWKTRLTSNGKDGRQTRERENRELEMGRFKRVKKKKRISDNLKDEMKEMGVGGKEI